MVSAAGTDRSRRNLTLPLLTPCVVPVLCCAAQPSFLPHYVQIASRKLLLFHGRRNLCVKAPGRAAAGGGRSSSSSSDLIIRLSDLVNSPVMAELQELLMLGPGAEQERDLFSNWFSLQVGEGVGTLPACVWQGTSRAASCWSSAHTMQGPNLCWHLLRTLESRW